MKKIKNNGGFTLVECVVAMAVLAIMSLLLAMILSVTVTARNNNRAVESEVDRQVSRIVENADITSEDYTKQIEFKKTDAAGAVIYSETIPGAADVDAHGNSYDIDAERVYDTDAENAEIDALKYDFDRYTVFDNIANGNTTTPPPAAHSNKAYGSEENTISISESNDDDGTKTEIKVKWTVSYNPKVSSDEKALKLILPKDFSDLNFGGMSKNQMLMINKDTVRIQSDNAVSAEIEFVLPRASFDKYVDLQTYFGVGISGVGNSISFTL